MKILLHYPQWGNRWIPYLEKELGQYELKISHSLEIEKLDGLCEWADILFSPWTNEIVGFWTQRFPQKKIVCFLRRFEFWEKKLHKVVDFSKINAMIFVNSWYKKKFDDAKWGIKTYLIPNGIDTSEFPIKEPTGEHKIAFVGQLKHVKNVGLALQILAELPKKYTLHHIGLPAADHMTGQVWSYVNSCGLSDRVFFYNPLKREIMPKWYADKDFIVSSSFNEGNPNCVLEAMASGMKPVIHTWPGAVDQFPSEFIFKTIREAKKIITEPKFEPERYRNYIEQHYSYDNLKKLHDVIHGVANE